MRFYSTKYVFLQLSPSLVNGVRTLYQHMSEVLNCTLEILLILHPLKDN